MQNKKSQSVPLLIILLALFLVLYIYLLPYEEKCKFIKLPECPAVETAEGKESVASSSGFVEGKVEYNLQNILLKSQHESDIAKIFENAKIEEGLFFSSPGEEAFSLHEKSDEAKLFVYVQEEKCVINCGLDVIINDFVFETVEGEGMHEITIPSFKLKETNFIKLRAKKPYLPFITNSY